MKRSELFWLRRVCGDPSALCGIKDYVFTDGPARGVNLDHLNQAVIP